VGEERELTLSRRSDDAAEPEARGSPSVRPLRTSPAGGGGGGGWGREGGDEEDLAVGAATFAPAAGGGEGLAETARRRGVGTGRGGEVSTRWD